MRVIWGYWHCVAIRRATRSASIAHCAMVPFFSPKKAAPSPRRYSSIRRDSRHLSTMPVRESIRRRPKGVGRSRSIASLRASMEGAFRPKRRSTICGKLSFRVRRRLPSISNLCRRVRAISTTLAISSRRLKSADFRRSFHARKIARTTSNWRLAPSMAYFSCREPNFRTTIGLASEARRVDTARRRSSSKGNSSRAWGAAPAKFRRRFMLQPCSRGSKSSNDTIIRCHRAIFPWAWMPSSVTPHSISVSKIISITQLYCEF